VETDRRKRIMNANNNCIEPVDASESGRYSESHIPLIILQRALTRMLVVVLVNVSHTCIQNLFSNS
jgi:hypothetical protein